MYFNEGAGWGKGKIIYSSTDTSIHTAADLLQLSIPFKQYPYTFFLLWFMCDHALLPRDPARVNSMMYVPNDARQPDNP